MDIETELAASFYRELTRELILQTNETIDEARLEEALTAGKGNWVDAGIIYDLLRIVKEME